MGLGVITGRRRTRSFVPRGRRAQRGFGVFFALVLIGGLAASAGLFTFYRIDLVQAKAERDTADILAVAKNALIGYAAKQGGATGSARPGELPCPDTDGDGLQNTPCNKAELLFGRLPWKTLGMPEPKDSAGETLWYALSGNFRNWDSFPAGTPTPHKRINSDTRGDIIVQAADGSTLTSDAVAVIFAPGASIGGQYRGAPNQSDCLAGDYSPTMCPNAYLENATGISQAASLNGPFTMAARSNTANDTLAYLETKELIPVVEMRVGNELKTLLTEYRVKSECQCYPWADTWEYSGGIADVGQNRGRFPTEPYPENWGEGDIPSLPAWLETNNWHNLFWYSVSRQASDPDKSCRTCTAAAGLTVGSVKAAALFFTPGTPADSLPRVPRVMPGASLTKGQRDRADNVKLYMQDATNWNGAACDDVGEIGGPNSGSKWPSVNANCDTYASPASVKRDRNRLYMLGATSAATCDANGEALALAVPCGGGWKITNPICKAVMPTLDMCTCAAAARTFAAPPCMNTLSPGKCEAAKAELLACTLAP